MATIVAIHSYSGGTGRSTLAANLANLLACQGKRVGVLDASLQSPGMSISYGLSYDQISYTFNDYLRGRCKAKDIAYDIHNILQDELQGDGKVYIFPASTRSEDIASVLTEGYDVDLLQESFYALDDALDLDILFVDVQSGVNEEIMNIISILDHLLLLFCPDPQDLMGTAMMVDLAKNLEVLNILLVANKVLPEEDIDALQQEVKTICHSSIAHILPFSLDMMRTGNESSFCLENPNHPLTLAFQQVAAYFNE
jgi:MinD-like ATPase involved in chromosome partitioning or flagellar assembly